jgi:hypothetical protein
VGLQESRSPQGAAGEAERIIGRECPFPLEGSGGHHVLRVVRATRGTSPCFAAVVPGGTSWKPDWSRRLRSWTRLRRSWIERVRSEISIGN